MAARGTGSSQLFAQRAAKLTKAAKTETDILQKLLTLCKYVQAFPEKTRIECLDAFCHRLQDPPNKRKFNEDSGLRSNILTSFLGIESLGKRGIGGSPVTRQTFMKTWPNLLKWLKLIFDTDFVYDEERRYVRLASCIFHIGAAVYEAGIETQAAFELSVAIWNGSTTQDGEEVFDETPLMYYLSQDDVPADRIDYLLLDCGNDASLLVDRILTRLTNATSVLVKKKHVDQSLVSFVSMLVFLLGDGNEDIKAAGITTRSGRVCSNTLKAILNNARPSSDNYFAIRELCEIIFTCVSYIGYPCSKVLIETGLLSSLLKVSTLENAYDPDPQHSRLSAILNLFIQHLAFEGVVAKCPREIQEHEYLKSENILGQSTKAFQQSWRIFETVLYEQLFLSRLFKGHVAEYGVCSLDSCGLTALRKRFQKCAGCSVALYCSNECQKADWHAHRCLCKKMDEKSLRILKGRITRFPRHVAAVQVNRHWEHLELLAKTKGIARKDMAFRVSFNRFPYKVEVLDVRQFLNDSRSPRSSPSPCHAVVAGEFRRAAFKDFAMVIVRCSGDIEVPYLAWMGDDLRLRTPYKFEKLGPDKGDGEVEIGNIFVDEDGRPLAVADMDLDGVTTGLRLAKQVAEQNGMNVWDEAALDEAARELMDIIDNNAAESVSGKEGLNT